MVSDELMLKVENVSKIYKLGEIGGTTLRDELQRLGAKIRHKPDPTKKVGVKNYNKGEKFKALDNISFEVKKGERIGIIGHNGAGKSTLLKLISRVTGPTEGNIHLNGRVASMLEVGTGFHPELTGRENVYMNGAILGMTKKEIDAKMEDIIEFSEVRQFIDTPVKRYSSGMYVKLAFSVAAHLDSEIMIMDEVLAVGDMAFQNKCLNKMKSVSEEKNRTILYVSHNMNTIRQLCNRVIVLNKGKIIFDGDSEIGISKYLDVNSTKSTINDLSSIKRESVITGDVFMERINLLNRNNTFVFGEKISFSLTFNCKYAFDNLVFRFNIYSTSGFAVGTMHSPVLKGNLGKNEIVFELDTSTISPGHYYIKIIAFQPTASGSQIRHDVANKAMYFDIFNNNQLFNFDWDNQYWGNVVFPDATIRKNEK